MKQETKLRATCLLLAAAALPLAPALAQDTQSAPPPPATEPAPPPAAQTPAPEPAPPPAQPVAAPVPEVTTAPAPAVPAATRTTTARTTARAPAPRVAVRTPAARPAVRTAPAVAPAASAAAATTPAATAAPPPEVAPTAPPVPIAAAPSTGVDTVAPAPAPQPDRSTALWPWLLLGALALAGLLLFALRRRRSVVRDEVYETEPETMVAPEPEVVAAPAAVAAEAGEPEIELGMEPVRAGVAGDGARVEFRLTVGNRGSAPAEDVRVSTWMLAAGSSDMERSLIEPRADAADTPPVTIGAGESRTMEAAVALPTSEVEGDALLPVVVADAAWRGPDGAEHHIRRSYAVGVPDGEELAHFDTENPSGLHEGVVAQALGEPEHA
ncbi:MAG: hypothetical protein QOG84_503 [Sphingomonadales bacterium]|jgi:hypothetical protein|nr:hypothetical protein [Sphingomonadales bacterium]